MPWLTVHYHPGFAEDLTSWETEIHRDGSLMQTVHICRFMPHEERTEQHQSLLTAVEVAELERLVAATDFTAIVAAMEEFCVTDVESISIQVEGSQQQILHAPLLFWHLMQKLDKSYECPAVADAIRLWQAVDRCSPHRLRK